jgi:hypothetical protein
MGFLLSFNGSSDQIPSICECEKFRAKSRWLSNLTYLAITCNSIIIEIYGDMNQVSHGFSRIDMLVFIAEITTFENVKAGPL